MKMRIIIIVLALVGGISAVIVFWFWFLTKNRFIYLDLAGPVVVSDEWVEIPIDPPLIPKRQVQRVALIINGARFDLDRKETFLPDGSSIKPEVEIKRRDGDWIKLRPGAGTANDFDVATNSMAAASIDFTLESEIAKAKPTFDAVRLRNKTPFTVAKVRWVDYYMK